MNILPLSTCRQKEMNEHQIMLYSIISHNNHIAELFCGVLVIDSLVTHQIVTSFLENK